MANRRRDVSVSSRRLMIRVTPEEMAAIRDRAKESGSSTSGYVRDCVLAEVFDDENPSVSSLGHQGLTIKTAAGAVPQ